jgi:hypothetical protein
MKKFLLWLGIIALPACCTFSGPKQAMRLTMAEQLEQESVALVVLVDDNGNPVSAADIEDPKSASKAELHAYCTGVWVSHDTVLTTEHCVDDIGKPKADATDVLKGLLDAITSNPNDVPKLWSPVGQRVTYSVRSDITTTTKAYNDGTVVAVDMVNDLALVKATSPGKHPVAHLSANVVHNGDELHMMGMTHDMWWCYIHGYVAAYRPTEPDANEHKRPMMQVQAPIYHGDSGGGAFDAEGNLVGVCDLVTSTVPEVAWYVPRSIVRVFLEHNRVIGPQR